MEGEKIVDLRVRIRREGRGNDGNRMERRTVKKKRGVFRVNPEKRKSVLVTRRRAEDPRLEGCLS